MSIARKLAEYVGEYHPGRFDWSRANCCHFAAGWVRKASGFDPMSGLPETPDHASAYRLIRKAGGFEAIVSRQLGKKPIAPTLAQIGDLVLMQLAEDRATVGICAGRTAVFVDERGASVHQEMSRAAAAWRIVP